MHDKEIAPIHAEFPGIASWLKAQGRPDLQDELRFAPTLTEQSFAPGEDELREVWPDGAWISWLGGPAVDPGTWPVNAAGMPLAHVATVHLDDAVALDTAGRATWPTGQLREGLPTEGILQVFHDLHTYGYDPSDRTVAGWHLLWTQDPAPAGQRPPLVDPPAHVGTPSTVCQAGLFLHGFSLPSPADRPGLPDDVFEEYEAIVHAVQQGWMVQRGLPRAEHHAIPSTHLYGYSSSGEAVPRQEVLPQVLPLAEGDEYRLVLEIESWTTLAGWFGDASSLEIWMRDSDLCAGAFDRAWCMIRTD